MNENQIVCKHCGDRFDTRGKYDAHYKRKHQKTVKLGDWKDDEGHIERSMDGKFTCICGKKFVKGETLILHQKKVRFGWRKKQVNQNLMMVCLSFKL